MSGPPTVDFLLEVGTEEIPDRFVARAVADLQRGLAEALEPAGILAPGARWSAWATPRRLAVAVDGVQPRQEDREEENVGPAVAVAFGPDGTPTRAAEGFARSQGVPVGSLSRVETPKGQYLAVRRVVEGLPAAAILAEACVGVLRRMRFGKMMRWGDVGFRFVRPIRWIVALLESEVVPFEIAGVASGRASRGLRGPAGSPSLDLIRARDYESVLGEAGVVPDPEGRRSIIREALEEAAADAAGRLVEDEGLLEILVYMTEAPSVIHGSFPPEYLELPREVLVTAMRHHQRYFSVVEPSGDDERLLPAFLAVLNRQGDPDGRIRRGNEWVLRARLADARFFWEEDRKRPLEERLPDLDRVIFQEKLGTYRQKTARAVGLVEGLGRMLGLSGDTIAAARRAAALARCDLTTQIVGEFPELQGVAGGIYARCDGEPPAVHEAVYDLYRPAGAADDLPRGEPGLLLALADRLDTLAGYFSLGLEPSGTRDPYALRRAALGVVRILMEQPWFLSLTRAVAGALDAYPAEVRESAEAGTRLREFLVQRFRHVAQSGGHRYDSVNAVVAVQGEDLHDGGMRLQALTSLRGEPRYEEDFVSLAAAYKRIRNLVRDQEEGDLDPATLEAPPEIELFRELERVETGLERSLEGRDYLSALREIAGLRPAVDGFLGSSRSEGVLVLAPEPDRRRNRLALLRRAGRLFRRVADFSEIVVEGESGPEGS